MKRLFKVIFITLLIHANFAFAANVEGIVSHADTKEPVAYALVIFILNDKEVARKITGDDGYYFIRNISKGTYTIRILYKEAKKEFSNIVVGSSGGTFNFEI